MLREEWYTKFKQQVRRKTKTLLVRDRNVESRRIPGQLGGERDFTGFRNVIMYFQLSRKLNLENNHRLRYILRYLDRFTHKKVGRAERFAPLFLNDENFKLIHYARMIHSENSVIQMVRDYYEEYAGSCEKYSHRLTELFPRRMRYGGGRRPPGREDLCLVFHDQDGIELAEEVRDKYEKTKRNWIWLEWKSKDVVKMRDEMGEWEF